MYEKEATVVSLSMGKLWIYMNMYVHVCRCTLPWNPNIYIYLRLHVPGLPFLVISLYLREHVIIAILRKSPWNEHNYYLTDMVSWLLHKEKSTYERDYTGWTSRLFSGTNTTQHNIQDKTRWDEMIYGLDPQGPLANPVVGSWAELRWPN